MIVSIRKALQGNPYILLVIGLAVGVIWLLPPSSQRSRMGYGPMATVNGQEIPYEEFARSLRSQQEYVSALRMQYGQFADDFLREMGLDDQRKLTAYVYDTLVRQTLLEQFANTLKMQLNPQYITDILNDPEIAPSLLSGLVPRAVFDEVGGINMQLLQRYLRQVGMSVADFEERVEQTLKIRLAMQIIDSAVYVPQFYLKDRYYMTVLGKKFAIATFDIKAFLDQEKKETLSKEELRAFFEAQNAARQRYFVPEKRAGKTWEFSAHTYGASATDDEVQAYYEENKVRKYQEKPAQVQVRRILIAATTDADMQVAYDRVRRIHEELAQDSSRFAAIAQESSDDKTTAKKGGLLPFFAKADKEQVISKAAFLLKNEGDISEIVQTKEGFEILQLVARQQPVYKGLSSVSASIKNELIQKRFEQQFAGDMQKIARSEENIENFVKARGAKTGSTGLIELGDTVLSQKLFSIHRKDAGQAIAFYVEGDKGHVVQLTQVQDRYLPEISSIQDVIAQDLHESRAAEKMQKFLDQAQKNLATGTALKEVAAQYNGKIEHTSLIKKDDKDAIQKLANRGLPTSRMMILFQEGAAIAASDGEQGYLVQLVGIEQFDQAAFEAQKKQLMQATKRDTTRVYTDAFVASLQRNATIKPNENLNTSGR